MQPPAYWPEARNRAILSTVKGSHAFAGAAPRSQKKINWNGNAMPDILVTDDGPVRIVQMNRPQKKNAITLAMYDAMAAAIDEASKAPSLRCVVLTGCPAGFCSGNDIGDFVAMTQSGALGAPVLHFLYALARCEKPLVAAVSGAAIGVGTTMLFHCDHVVAASDAKFSAPFVALGLIPEAGSSLIAPRLMGHARAFSLLVMGQVFSAEDAKAAGFVNAIVSPAEVETAARAAAHTIAKLPPEGVLLTRRLLRGSSEEIVDRIGEEVRQFKRRLQKPEAREAFAAFLDRKR